MVSKVEQILEEISLATVATVTLPPAERAEVLRQVHKLARSAIDYIASMGVVIVDGRKPMVSVYCAEKYGVRQAEEKTAIIMDYLWKGANDV
jgi:radical SAM superfamily enzyme